MKTYECIVSRRSIRNYNQKRITKKDFISLIKAASMAPSGSNAQPWHFYIIRNKKIIQKMKDIVLEYSSTPNLAKKYGTFFNAPYVISVCIDINRRWYHSKPGPQKIKNIEDVLENPDYFSVATAIQNLLLSAHSINIGTCWCKISKEYRNKLEKLLNIPPHRRIVANIAIGYYDKKKIPSKPSRKPLKNICTFIK